MPEVQHLLKSASGQRESLGRHGAHVGIAVPMRGDVLVVEVATKVLVSELSRRLPALTVRLFAPDPSAGWRRWPDAMLIETLDDETPSLVDALLILDLPTRVAFGWSPDSRPDLEGDDGILRLPLTSMTEDTAVDIEALLDLAQRTLPHIEHLDVIAGLRTRGMWTSDEAVLVDVGGDEHPDWWWSVVEARAAAIGAGVLTSNFDASQTIVATTNHPHLSSNIGPETMTIAMANAAAVITDDDQLARLARALGTPCSAGDASSTEALSRMLVDQWSYDVGTSSARLLTLDLALDKVAAVASATASLRSPSSYNAATARLTRRVSALETAHERIVARMVAERRVTSGSIAEAMSKLHQADEDLAELTTAKEQLARVLVLTQTQLHKLQILESRERHDSAHLGWRRWKLLRGLRRLVPLSLRLRARRIVRRLRPAR